VRRPTLASCQGGNFRVTAFIKRTATYDYRAKQAYDNCQMLSAMQNCIFGNACDKNAGRNCYACTLRGERVACQYVRFRMSGGRKFLLLCHRAASSSVREKAKKGGRKKGQKRGQSNFLCSPRSMRIATRPLSRRESPASSSLVRNRRCDRKRYSDPEVFSSARTPRRANWNCNSARPIASEDITMVCSCMFGTRFQQPANAFPRRAKSGPVRRHYALRASPSVVPCAPRPCAR